MYWVYIKAGGGWIVFSIVLFFLTLTGLLQVGNTLVISIWTDNVLPDGSYISFSLDFFLIIYAVSAIVLAVAGFLRGE